MFKKLNKKGFTLAELLVVVAIIGVLVAISIPIFTAQLEKARDAVTLSNLRAAYAQAQTAYLTKSGDGDAVVYSSGTVTVKNVVGKGTVDGLENFDELPFSKVSGSKDVKSNFGNLNGNTKNLKFTYTDSSGLTKVEVN